MFLLCLGFVCWVGLVFVCLWFLGVFGGFVLVFSLSGLILVTVISVMECKT